MFNQLVIKTAYCQLVPSKHYVIEHNILPLFHDDSACLTFKFLGNASEYLTTQISLLARHFLFFYANAMKLHVRMRKCYLHTFTHAQTLPEVGDALAARRKSRQLKVCSKPQWHGLDACARLKSRISGTRGSKPQGTWFSSKTIPVDFAI